MSVAVNNIRVFFRLLFAFSYKKYSQCSGSAVARYRAAGDGFADLLKARIQFVYLVAHLRRNRGIAFGMCNEDPVPVDIVAIL